MFRLSDLRKAGKKATANAKRDGTALVDSRTKKIHRTINGVDIQTFEVPLTEAERQHELDRLLSEGTSATSRLTRHTIETSTPKIDPFGDMQDGQFVDFSAYYEPDPGVVRLDFLLS